MAMTVEKAVKKTAEKDKNTFWHWPAYLQLRLSSSQRGTTLSRCRHKGPLYVQKPFYPEGRDCAHIYLLHPPGGMVSGDTLSIEITAEDNTNAVITTPGAARAYRARPQLTGMTQAQVQNITLRMGNSATIEWFPMETIIYDGAAAELNTHIELTEGSQFFGWEVTCLGLPASQALMQQGFFTQHYKIMRDGLPVFIDYLHFDASNAALFNSSAGMQGKTVSGFFVASNDRLSGEENARLLDSMRLMLEENSFAKLVAISHVKGFFVIRYLGSSANEARKIFTELWDMLRPSILNKSSCHPRIWLT